VNRPPIDRETLIAALDKHGMTLAYSGAPACWRADNEYREALFNDLFPGAAQDQENTPK
jgi:hypothetical protein